MTTLLAPLLLAIAAHAPEDLADLYPGRMTWSESGLSTRCEPGDVWRLGSFELQFGRDFEVSCGKAVVALGVHEENVLWAVVFPEKPARIRAKDQPGDGELARTIFLRFAPGEIGRVFPKRTVKGNGDSWLRAEAVRISRNKIGHKWFTPAGNPTVVQPGYTLVDCDTTDGLRRFYELDGNAGKVTYVPEFESRPVLPDVKIERPEAQRAFEEVWEAFDREYANFVLLPDVNWDRLGKEYEKALDRVETRHDLAAVLADLLGHLRDLHVWVKAGDDWLPGFTRTRPLNGSRRGSAAELGAPPTEGRHGLAWGRTLDGIGYLDVGSLSDQGLTAELDAALEGLADCWAMVVDLRFNGGGDELLGRAVAGRFLDEPRVYSKNRYRSGPKRDQLGEVLERTVEPRGPWRFESPVVVLQGRRTMSSAESLALMLAQCPQVTTMGDRTAGSSANPRRLELECGITVNLPRWHDMDPDGNPIEHAGIAPDVVLEFPPDRFTEQADPVLGAALVHLRKTVASKDRLAGRR